MWGDGGGRGRPPTQPGQPVNPGGQGGDRRCSCDAPTSSTSMFSKWSLSLTGRRYVRARDGGFHGLLCSHGSPCRVSPTLYKDTDRLVRDPS